MQWVASTLHTTSEHGVSSITTADAHTSAASSRLIWTPPPLPANLNGLVLCAERPNLVSAHVPSCFERAIPLLTCIVVGPASSLDRNTDCPNCSSFTVVFVSLVFQPANCVRRNGNVTFPSNFLNFEFEESTEVCFMPDGDDHFGMLRFIFFFNVKDQQLSLYCLYKQNKYSSCISTLPFVPETRGMADNNCDLHKQTMMITMMMIYVK